MDHFHQTKWQSTESRKQMGAHVWCWACCISDNTANLARVLLRLIEVSGTLQQRFDCEPDRCKATVCCHQQCPWCGPRQTDIAKTLAWCQFKYLARIARSKINIYTSLPRLRHLANTCKNFSCDDDMSVNLHELSVWVSGGGRFRPEKRQ